MRQIGLRIGLWSGCVFLCVAASAAHADNKVTPQQILAYRPRQEVQISTPTTEAEIAACKVEVVAGANGGNAWLLRDGRGLPLRKIADTKGTRKPDTYSYYLDGVEVYREVDSNQSGKPDQFRWFGPAGMRWGVDVNGDGVIDGWRQISVEEVSQEMVRAIATRNLARLQALAISDAELKSLELPAAETNRIREAVAKLPQVFQAAVTKAGITDQTRWEHLEAPYAPQCIPADAMGGKYDLFRYRSCRVLYGTPAKNEIKHDWLQTGELIQVGRAWRVVTGPSVGHLDEEVAAAPNAPDGTDADLRPLYTQLEALDKTAPTGDNPAAVVKYNLARAEILGQIAAKMRGEQQEQWIKQMADCFVSAVQAGGNGSNTAYQRLVDLRDRVAKAAPRSPLAGYIAFREMTAEHTAKLSEKGADFAKVQEAWRDRLKDFVDKYPTAEDAPDAINQLGILSEFAGKEKDAVSWYEMLATKYPKSPLSAKGRGALKRLNSEGQVFELTSKQLGTGAPFNLANLRGQIVVVYYWASWNSQCGKDLFTLTKLAKDFEGPNRVQIVTVNVDNDPAAATAFLQKNPAVGVHLFQEPSGLDGALAAQYGVNVLPQLFLIGKDGKVVSHTVQVSSLEDEIKRLISPCDIGPVGKDGKDDK